MSSSTGPDDTARHPVLRATKWVSVIVWLVFWLAVTRIHLTHGAMLDVVFTGAWAVAPVAVVLADAVGANVGVPGASEVADAVSR